MAYNKLAKETYRNWHEAVGLCRECPERATHGNKCRKHWLMWKGYQRKHSSERIARYREEKKCTACGAPLDGEMDSPTKCINCLNWKRVKQHERGKDLR
jgi:hypothetical protein